MPGIPGQKARYAKLKHRPYRRAAWVLLFLFLGVNHLVRLPGVQWSIHHGRWQKYDIKMNQAGELPGDVDILCLGNSRVYYCFDPMLFQDHLSDLAGRSLKAWNLGLSGSVPEAHALLWDAYLDTQARMPGVLLLEVSAFGVSSNYSGYEETMAFYYRLEHVPMLLGEGRVQDAIQIITYELLPLYRYQRWVKEFFYGLRPGEPEEIAGKRQGFFAPGSTAPGMTPEAAAVRLLDVYQEWLTDFSIAPAQDGALRRILESASARQIPVVLFSIPVSTPLLRDYEASGVRQVLQQYCDSLADEYDVPYVNMINETYSTRYRFADVSHVEIRSVAAFMADLAPQIWQAMSEDGRRVLMGRQANTPTP